MVGFTNRSIDLLETIVRDSNNIINMNRRGYALATRTTNIENIVKELHDGLGDTATELLRYHETAHSPNYRAPVNPDWEDAPSGVDILRSQELIRKTFPSYEKDVETVVHIRRGGDISGQQLGMYMLDYLKGVGVKRIVGTVEAISKNDGYRFEVQTDKGNVHVAAEKVVNAAGPFAQDIASMLDVKLPIFNTFQQKIAFEDREKTIPRNLPFTIDLDGQQIDWMDEERELILENPDFRWLAEGMPGAIHCRPDGGDNARWVKLGWAYNDTPGPPTWEPPLDEYFPDIVLRGAARLNPKLRGYYGRLPRSMHHYGGCYTMTEENWPLIGKMGLENAYMNCAYSGFGTMAACAGGELCASWIAGSELPQYARGFSLDRYNDEVLMQSLHAGAKGVL